MNLYPDYVVGLLFDTPHLPGYEPCKIYTHPLILTSTNLKCNCKQPMQRYADRSKVFHIYKWQNSNQLKSNILQKALDAGIYGMVFYQGYFDLSMKNALIYIYKLFCTDAALWKLN